MTDPIDEAALALGLMRSALGHLDTLCDADASLHLTRAIDRLSRMVPTARQISPGTAALVEAIALPPA